MIDLSFPEHIKPSKQGVVKGLSCIYLHATKWGDLESWSNLDHSAKL